MFNNTLSQDEGSKFIDLDKSIEQFTSADLDLSTLQYKEIQELMVDMRYQYENANDIKIEELTEEVEELKEVLTLHLDQLESGKYFNISFFCSLLSGFAIMYFLLGRVCRGQLREKPSVRIEKTSGSVGASKNLSAKQKELVEQEKVLTDEETRLHKRFVELDSFIKTKTGNHTFKEELDEIDKELRNRKQQDEVKTQNQTENPSKVGPLSHPESSKNK